MNPQIPHPDVQAIQGSGAGLVQLTDAPVLAFLYLCLILLVVGFIRHLTGPRNRR